MSNWRWQSRTAQWGKNIGAENAVDFLFAPKTGGAALRTEIDRDHRFVDQIERADPERFRDPDH